MQFLQLRKNIGMILTISLICHAELLENIAHVQVSIRGMLGDMLDKFQEGLSDASVEDKHHGTRVNTVASGLFVMRLVRNRCHTHLRDSY